MRERPPAISGLCNYPPLLDRAGRSVTCPPPMDKAWRQKGCCQDCRKVTDGRKIRSDFMTLAEKTGELMARQMNEESISKTNWGKNRNR